MNRRVTFALVALLLIMLAVLGLMNDNNEQQSNDLFLPALKSNLNQLDTISIGQGSEAVLLQRSGGVWQVSSRDNYPADLNKLQDVMAALADAVVLERKTAREENHAQLELDLQQGKIIEFSGPDYSGALVAGIEAAMEQGMFVRHKDDNQTWLIDKPINVSADVTAWLDPIILDVDVDQIQRVVLYDKSANLVVEVKQEDGQDNLVLTNLPEGRTLRYDSITNTFQRALVNLRLEDVALHDTAVWANAHRAEFTREAGVITVMARQEGETFWIHVEGASPGVNGWDFQVASHHYDTLTKDLEDLLAPLPE